MFGIITKKDKRTNLEKEIDSVLESMKAYEPDSDEYTQMVKNIEMLRKADSHTKSSNVPWKEITTGVFGLIGIVAILGYEKTDIITSKALGFVLKGRV